MNWAEFNKGFTDPKAQPATTPGWNAYNEKFKKAGRVAEANVYKIDPDLYTQVREKYDVSPQEVDKNLNPQKTSYLKTLGQTAKDTVLGALNPMNAYRGVRASSQLLATPLAGALAMAPGGVKPSEAMKESLGIAKRVMAEEEDPEKSIETASQEWLKMRGVGKYGGKDPDVLDVAALTALGTFNLLGDPAFEYGLAVKGGKALKEFATWKKVGSATKELGEGTKILKPIEREFAFSPDFKLKVKPTENAITLEGFRRRFPSQAALPDNQLAAETADLITATREATGWEMQARFVGDDLQLTPVRPTYNPKPITPYDTPEVIRARNEKMEMKSTHLIDTPERTALREQIATKLYGTGALNKDKRADIVIGQPAAGKSTVMVKPLQGEHGSLVIDSDDAKELLPENAGGRYAGIVHEESDLIAKQILQKALEAGDNIVLPIVGKNVDKLRKMRDALEARGYEVNLHLNTVPPEKAAQRAVERFEQTGRFVDPAYILNEVGLTPDENYAILKAEGKFNSYEAYSNDVPRGQAPRLIERTESRPRPSVERGTAFRRRQVGRQGTRSSRATLSKVADKAYQNTVKNGGVTINLKGKSPKKGYAYSPYKDSETVIPKEKFSEKDVVAFMKKFKDRLAEPGNHLGIWEDNGKIYLDVSQVGEASAKTVTKAEQAGQLGVFDLEKFQTIYTKLSPDYEKTSSLIIDGKQVAGGSGKGGDGGSTKVPVGGGATRTSRLAEGVEASAIEAGLTDSFGDLPQYQKMNFKEQGKLALDLVTEDFELAKRVAKGLDLPPNGLIPEAVFVAVEQAAKKAKDVDLLRELSPSSLSLEATAMGQRIAYLAERNPYSPVTAMQEVAKGRAKKLGKTLKQAKDETVAGLKAELKKVKPKKEDWESFIASIECK